MRPPPLAGIRVLDLTRLLPGPMCSLHLADMGADVIKVEDPKRGDYARSMGSYYHAVNRNKRSLKLDLKQASGRDVFLRLAATCDVIMEGFRPGTVDRLGVGYCEVRKRNPRIVYCSITGYGQDGPYRSVAGHDLNYCSYTGVIDQTGPRHGPPSIPNIQYADLLGGSLSAAMAILAAVVDVQRAGQGRYVDVAMADCVLAHAVIPLMAHQQGGDAPRGGDLLSGGLPWYAVYATADGRHVALAALEKKFWRRFCNAIGRADWVDVFEADNTAREQLRGELVGLFSARTQARWVDRLGEADCCFSPVLTFTEALQHPQFQARRVVGDDGRRATHFAFPVKFSDFEFSMHRPAPEHGQHSRPILSELGYSEAEITELERHNTI